MDVHSYTTAIRLWLASSVFTQAMNAATMMGWQHDAGEHPEGRLKSPLRGGFKQVRC